MARYTTYEDFDLLIEPTTDSGYRARVLSSPVGETRPVAIAIPFSDLELEHFLLRIGRPRRQATRGEGTSEAAAVREFGSRLFDAVFTDRVRRALTSSLDQVEGREDTGLRVRLRLSDCPELAELPWEYLYDPDARRFLALSPWTPLIRYLELPDAIRPLTVRPPLRILVMIASPTDFEPLDVDGEWSKVRNALDDLQEAGRVQIDWMHTGTLGNLRRQLRRTEYHVFHYIGHGRYDPQAQDGVLALEGPGGRTLQVSGADVGALLYDHRSLRMAVLNSCEGYRGGRTDPYSQTAQSLIRQGIPAVVAMQFEMTDDAAMTFFHSLYEAVADGYPLDAAMAEARNAVRDEPNPVEWATPVLYLRAADAVIFNTPSASYASEHLSGQPLMTDPIRSRMGARLDHRESGLPEPDRSRTGADTSESPTGVTGPAPEIALQPPEVFLCHSSGDKEQVRDLYHRLTRDGVHCWFDEEDLLPGQDWDREITRALRSSRYVLACLSRASITKAGYVQKELKRALDLAKEQPAGSIFLIPVRLEPCEVPDELKPLQWADLFEPNGYQRLLRTLQQGRAPDGRIFDVTEPGTPSSDTPEPTRTDHRREAQLLDQARAQHRLGHYDATLRLLDDLLTLNPTYPEAAELQSTTLHDKRLADIYRRAVKAETAANWPTAVASYTEILDTNPTYRDAPARRAAGERRQQIADLQAKLRHHATAESWQAVLDIDEQLRRLDPATADPDGLATRARQALQQAERAADLDRRYAQAHSHEDAEDWEAAVISYGEIVDIEAGYRDAAQRRDACRHQLELTALRAERDRQSAAREAQEQARRETEKQTRREAEKRAAQADQERLQREAERLQPPENSDAAGTKPVSPIADLNTASEGDNDGSEHDTSEWVGVATVIGLILAMIALWFLNRGGRVLGWW